MAALAVPAAPAVDMFPTIGEQVETTEEGTMEIPSMCPTCREDGVTRMMLTRIPFFREIIVSSFECLNEECNERNTFVQFGGAYQEAGIECVLTPKVDADLSRSVVRSEQTTIRIPELDFEIPPRVGEITTVEGLLAVALETLEQGQVLRRITQPEVAEKIEVCMNGLKACLKLERPWTLVLRDPTGNAFIQNPVAPHPDPLLKVTHFQRSAADDEALGLTAQHEGQGSGDGGGEAAIKPAADYNTRRTTKQEELVDEGQLELGYTLPEVCFACKRDGNVKLAMISIPHFKETVIMSFVCDYCGFKSNEVKTGGSIPDHGTRLTLKVQDIEDLSRDVLKSHTCSVQIPEIDLELSEGSLGSMFTTVEGLLTQMKAQLENTAMASFTKGDSATPSSKTLMQRFIASMESMRKAEIPWTLILDDPLGHSYLQSVTDVPEDDPRLTAEKYTRTEEQNNDLGITDLEDQDRRDEVQREADSHTEDGHAPDNHAADGQVK
jgi:zinc finger protein